MSTMLLSSLIFQKLDVTSAIFLCLFGCAVPGSPLLILTQKKTPTWNIVQILFSYSSFFPVLLNHWASQAPSSSLSLLQPSATVPHLSSSHLMKSRTSKSKGYLTCLKWRSLSHSCTTSLREWQKSCHEINVTQLEAPKCEHLHWITTHQLLHSNYKEVNISTVWFLCILIKNIQNG